VAEGEQVIVAGGVNGSGAVTDVERIDATMPRAPVAVGVIGAVPGAGIAAARVHTGSVLLVGAGQRNAWLFRH
jgi:hypothetical protein